MHSPSVHFPGFVVSLGTSDYTCTGCVTDATHTDCDWHLYWSWQNLCYWDSISAEIRTAEQVQASYDSMASIADGFKGIVRKLKSVASQGRIMAALLKMQHNRTKAPVLQMGGTPMQHHRGTCGFEVTFITPFLRV